MQVTPQPADVLALALRLLQKPSTQGLVQNSLSDIMVKDNSINTEFLTVQEIILFNITMNKEMTPHKFNKEQRF